jgi:acetyl-CoA acetyltransferase family protein
MSSAAAAAAAAAAEAEMEATSRLMGDTAENVAHDLGLSREEQDRFAVESHRKAVEAGRLGYFAGELMPVVLPKGAPIDADEGPRADTSVEQLALLKPAFRKGGSVTAGNSSTLNDGAAALVLASAERAAERGWRVRARIRAMASAGCDPTRMGLGPVPAVHKALRAAGLTVADVGVWELNEAFAAQSLGVIRQLGIDEGRVNLHGGAIALGHPLGCSGARVLTTLLGVMERTGATVGCATLCVGVGQGVATVIERV